METFRSFDIMLQAYWIVALTASVIFVIQAISMFIGFDSDAIDTPDAPDAVSDFDADGFHLVSFKTIVCFLLGFGWTGVLFWDIIPSPLMLGLLAFIVGMGCMLLIAYLLYLVMKLDKDNTFHIEQTVGLTAEVYLAIPAQKSDSGKIMVSVNGSTHELEALTEDEERIATGSTVKIVNTLGNEKVLVSAHID